MNIQSVAGVFAGIPLDWLIAGIALVVMVLGTMLRGTGYATALSLSLPVAWILLNVAGLTAFIGPIVRAFSAPADEPAVFAVLLVIIFICMYRICATFDHSSPPLVALIVSIATIIVVLVFWVLLSPFMYPTPGTQIQSVFGDQYALFWLIAAYLALAFARS